MARVKFLCDVERCIDCSGCVVACKEGHHVPVGVNRRRVITLDQGKPGEKSISVSCMHCADAPCIAVCPVDAIYQRDDGIVLVNKKTCIGCGYCFMACPFGAPQFPKGNIFGARGAMDKCTFCAGGPEENFSTEEKKPLWSEQDRRGQSTALRRYVCDKSPAGRGCRCGRRCLPRAGLSARFRRQCLGLEQGLQQGIGGAFYCL
jgi:Fe-S-cluster-containing hydrogenase component 2